MTRVYGLFVINNSIFKELPWELKALIITPLKNDILLYLIKKFPGARWDWDNITRLASIKDILKFQYLPWKWDIVCYKKGFHIGLVEKYPDIPWCWWGLSCVADMEYIKSHKDNPWVLRAIQYNSKVTTEVLDLFDNGKTGLYASGIVTDPGNYMTKCNNSYVVSKNPNLTIDIIIGLNVMWDWNAISKYANIKIEDIKRYPDLPWNWNKFVFRLPIKKLVTNFHKQWNWTYLSAKAKKEDIGFLVSIIETDWIALSKNRNVDEEVIETYIYAPWDWSVLTSRSDISWQFIYEYNYKPWDWKLVKLFNYNIKCNSRKEFLKNYMDIKHGKIMPNNIAALSKWNYLTKEIVLEKINEKWNLVDLIFNSSLSFNDKLILVSKM